MESGSGSNRRWSKTAIVEEIKNLPEYSAKYVQRARPELYGAAVRHFGSWKSAVEESGLDYANARKKRPLGYWTRETVIENIRTTEKKHSAYVRKKHADLYNAALRIFGSWKNAVEAAGYDYRDIQKGVQKSEI